MKNIWKWCTTPRYTMVEVFFGALLGIFIAQALDVL